MECSPNGRNAARAPVCNAQNIRAYPTWIIAGQRYPQVLSVERLSELSNYTGPPNPAGR